MMPTSIDAIAAHLRKLTADIGVRLAGSDQEAAAAGYVAEQFAKAGAKVSTEEFPAARRRVILQELRVRVKNRWRKFPCSLLSNTPGTDGKMIEAPIVFFAAETDYQRADLSFLRGKAVVHLGVHIESRDVYRRLIEAAPAFILIVDVGYPGTVPLADGMFPAYTRAIGAIPTVSVAYMDVWRWKAEGADAARLRVEGGMVKAVSQNVIAELPGTDPASGMLLLGGHHDTQADSVGADDNATGVAGILELARVLGRTAHKRAIRLISFGAEEQLSVGSAVYARAHREELSGNAHLMFNLDSYGSHLGWTELVCNGPKELADFLRQRFEAAGQFVKINGDIVPYADHFPFVAAGVPGVYMGRLNCTAGRFFHHRPDDDLSRVSVPLMAELLNVVGNCISTLADAEAIPFGGRIPPDQFEQATIFWQDLFGGWSDVRQVNSNC